jgi:hypothetical protein
MVGGGNGGNGGERGQDAQGDGAVHVKDVTQCNAVDTRASRHTNAQNEAIRIQVVAVALVAGRPFRRQQPEQKFGANCLDNAGVKGGVVGADNSGHKHETSEFFGV